MRQVSELGEVTGDAVLGGFGMSWPDFDEYETPIDLAAAIDGD
jgi:hypothetical protein